MTVGVSHQLVGFLGGRVKADKMIYIVIYRERQLDVGPVHRAGGSVNQMFDFEMPAVFQDVPEANQIAVDIGARVFQRIADTRLGGKVDHELGSMLVEQLPQRVLSRDISPAEYEIVPFLEKFQPALFQIDVVVIIQVVHTDHGLAMIEQATGQVKANDPRRPGDQNWSHALRLSGPSWQVKEEAFSAAQIRCTACEHAACIAIFLW